MKKQFSDFDRRTRFGVVTLTNPDCNCCDNRRCNGAASMEEMHRCQFHKPVRTTGLGYLGEEQGA
jgi:hypothetical protein